MFYNDLNIIFFKRSKQMNNILILYSTTDGHTLTISKTIANYLKTNSNILVTPLINCTKDDLKNNDVIIIGASIRYGKHNPKVKEFIENNLMILETKKNAFFTALFLTRKKRIPSNKTKQIPRKYIITTSNQPIFSSIKNTYIISNSGDKNDRYTIFFKAFKITALFSKSMPFDVMGKAIQGIEIEMMI